MTMRVLVLLAFLGASEAALRSAPLAVKRVNGHVQLSAQQQKTMHSGCVSACKPSPVESKCATACETAMYKCIDETGPNETPKDTEKCQGDVLKLFTDTKGLAKKEGGNATKGNATKAEAKKEKKAKMLLELSDVDEDEENDSASSGVESSEDDATDSEVTDEQEEEDAAAKAEQENTDAEEESSGEEEADDSEDAEAGEDAEASEDSEESNEEEAEEGSEEEETEEGSEEEEEEPMDEEADEEDSFVQVSRGSDDGDEEADIDVSKDEGEETKAEEKTNVDESEAEDDESDVTAHDNSGPHEDAGEEDKKEAPAPKAEAAKKEAPAPKAEEEESLMQVGSDWKPEHGSGFHLYEHPQGSTVVTPCPISGHGAPESCGAYFAGKADGAKCPQISCPRALGVTMKLTCSGGCCPTCWAPDHVLAIDRHTSIDDAATVDSAPQAPSSCGGVKCFQLNCASGFTEGHVSGSCCYSCVPGR